MKSRGRKIRDADLEFNKSYKGELRKKNTKQNKTYVVLDVRTHSPAISLKGAEKTT